MECPMLYWYIMDDAHSQNICYLNLKYDTILNTSILKNTAVDKSNVA